MLSSSTLETELSSIEKTYPGIFTLTNSDLENSEKELLILEKHTEEQLKLIHELKSLEKSQLVTLSKLELQSRNLKQDYTDLHNECLRTAKEVTEWEKKCCDLQNDLQISIKTPCSYMHQIPQYMNKNNINTFIKELEKYLNQNQIFTGDGIPEQEYNPKLDQLQQAKDYLVEAKKYEIEKELNIKAFENGIRQISTIQLPSDVNQLR